MQLMTSSHAKQNFGELLDALSQGPVAIEKHKKIKAIVCTPAAYQAANEQRNLQAERQAARAAQALVDKNRLIKHHQVAIALLQSTRKQREALLLKANAEVDRWERNRLCSPDYIERWRTMLGMPLTQLIQSMTSEQDAWAGALRQNSPWHVVLA